MSPLACSHPLLPPSCETRSAADSSTRGDASGGAGLDGARDERSPATRGTLRPRARMTATTVHSLGDRVEGAIERHADTPGEIERGEHEKPHNLRRNAIWLAVTLVSLYVVFPKLVEVFGSWHQITRFSVASLIAMALLQVASNACL